VINEDSAVAEISKEAPPSFLISGDVFTQLDVFVSKFPSCCNSRYCSCVEIRFLKEWLQRVNLQSAGFTDLSYILLLMTKVNYWVWSNPGKRWWQGTLEKRRVFERNIRKNICWQRLYIWKAAKITFCRWNRAYNIRNNMKNSLMSMSDKILLRKRSVIETVNDELKNIFK